MLGLAIAEGDSPKSREATVEGAEAAVAIETRAGGERRAVRLAPGGTAKLTLTGPIAIAIELRAGGALSKKKVQASLRIDGKRDDPLAVSGTRDRATKATSTEVVGRSVSRAFSLGRGVHTIEIGWPKDAGAPLLLSTVGVDLTPKAALEAKGPGAVTKAETQAEARTKVEARSATPEAVVAAVSAPSAGSLDAAVLAGVFVPRRLLGVGPFAFVEARYALPIRALEGRARGRLALGTAVFRGRATRIVPGRGLDSAFLQTTAVVPLELALSYDVLGGGPAAASKPFTLSAGIGFGLLFVWTDFVAFSTTTRDRALGTAALGLVTVSTALGPGRLLVDLRYRVAGANLGPLGEVGTDDLSGLSATAGYSLSL